MSYQKLDREYFSKHKKDLTVLAFDLDDTLTVGGELPARVHERLELARDQGYKLVLVTGRAAGWVDALVKLLPFDGIVGENGALLQFWPKGKALRGPREEPKKLFWTSTGFGAAPPTDIQKEHAKASATILARYPKARVASDQPFRLYDLAIDFAEEVDPPLSLDDARGIQVEFEKLGATAKVSSIHVNGWWGTFTKVDGLAQLLEVQWGSHAVAKNLIYVGDSPNDGPLFKAAACSVGVANVLEFKGRVEFSEPKFVCTRNGGDGAVELIDLLLSL